MRRNPPLQSTQVCLVCQQRCDGKLPVDAEKPAPTIGFEYTPNENPSGRSYRSEEGQLCARRRLRQDAGDNPVVGGSPRRVTLSECPPGECGV